MAGQLTNNSGATITDSGTVHVTSSGSLINNGTFTVNSGGVLNFAGTYYIGNLVDNGVIDFTSGVTYTGVISGTGSVTVAAGTYNTVVFTGANTYTGATTVTSGTLQLGNGRVEF